MTPNTIHSTGGDKERQELCQAFTIDFKALVHAQKNGTPLADTEDAQPEGRWGRPNPTSRSLAKRSPAHQKALDARVGELRAGDIVSARLNRMASDLRGERDKGLTPLRDLPFSTKAKKSAVSALERHCIHTVQQAIDYMHNTGAALADALALIPGVGKPSAAELARQIVELTGEPGEPTREKTAAERIAEHADEDLEGAARADEEGAVL
jgi:hypothetical protein